MVSSSPSAARVKQSRACTVCHRAKSKCAFSDNQSKCDRCLRLNRTCVPHVSRQGQRVNKTDKDGKVAATVPVVVPTTRTWQDRISDEHSFGPGNISADSLEHPGSDNLCVGLGNGVIQASLPFSNDVTAGASLGAKSDDEGARGGSRQYQSTAVMYNLQAGTNDGPDRNAPNFHAPNWSIPSNNGNQTARTHTSFPTNQRGEASLKCDITMGMACEAASNAQHLQPTAIETSQPTMTIPLRQWIQGEFDPDGMGNYVRGRYLASCLQIASSLSEQITNAEECSKMRLRLLPHDLSNWAGFVLVKVDRSGSSGHDVHEPVIGSSSSPDLESERLAALLDSIGEEDEVDTALCFDKVVSAEILVYDSHQGGADLLLRRDNLQRIYALGLVFYELFSGGQLSRLELMQSSSSRRLSARNAETMDDSLEKLVNYRTVNLSDTLTLDGDNEAGVGVSTRIGSGRKKILNSQVSCNSSFESLKRIGLPSPLCELLCNMIDCVNGDLRGHESYSKMSEVAYDLQLMKDNPSMFLHDLDVVNLSSTGLQMSDHLYMRENELTTLKNAYQCSAAGSSEFAIISGSSGTGKSHLALCLGSHISHDGVFLCVKFNQLQMANPFSALASAFNDYCTMFTAIKDSDWVKSFASKLRDALGPDTHHLVRLVPALSSILDCDTSESAQKEDCVNGQRKIHYLLTRFVEIISACSRATVTLFLDDLQWADEFSLSALEQIMVMPNQGKRFFFVGCYRDDEVTDDHPLKKVVDKASENGVRLTKIQLKCMDKNSVNKIVSDLLCLSPRLVKSLSEIVYCKTKGNPLFFSRLLMSLNRDGLLHLSLSRRRWVWDEELIQSRQLPDDVASLFLSDISRLSLEVQEALGVLSCFGSIEEKELSILERNLGLQLLYPLEVAVDEGFVCKNKAKYTFAHDRIQEAVYCLIPLNNRRHDHMRYGTCLVRAAVEHGGDDVLFSALGQINLAGPSLVTDSNQSTEFARCHMIAGVKAVELSDFSSASKFVKSGMLFLTKHHWRDHYRLSIEMFELGAKISLVLGDFGHLALLYEHVQEHACSFEDTIDISISVMISLAHASKIPDSINMGLSMLTTLGHELPNSLSQTEITALIKQTQTELSGISDSALMEYRQMTDTTYVMAMKILAKLELPAFLVNPALHPIITLKMVNMSINHGMSVVSPVGFAYFGSMLAKVDEMQDGVRFARLAKKMIERGGSRQIAGDVIFTTCEVISFFEPFRSVNEYRIQGQAIASAAGDVYFACMLRLLYCAALLWSGVNLIALKRVFAEAARFMKSQNSMTTYFFLLNANRSVSALIEDSDEDFEDELTKPQFVTFFYLQKMFQSYVLNRFDEMRQYVEKFFELRKSSWMLLSTYAAHEFYGGLASYRIYRETGDTLWLKRGKQCKSRLQLWAEQGSSWNFTHKLLLMDAEEHFCHHNNKSAQTSYTQAITLAEAHKFVNDEALACELSGYFYLNTGNSATSLGHFTRAYKKYMEWGASAKVRIIEGFVQEKFGCNLCIVVDVDSRGSSCDNQ